MAVYEFDWVDAFTETPFGGNACVVVHGADGMSVEDRLRLVRETSLSECAYLVASDQADFGARYYLPDREILMAGHPTIATVTSLAHRGLVDLSAGRASFTLEVGAGVLPIEVEARESGAPLITMTQRRPEFRALQDAAEVTGIFGLSAGDVAHPPQIVSTGTSFCIILLRDHDAIRRARVQPEALASWQRGHGRDRVHRAVPGDAERGGDGRYLRASSATAADAGGGPVHRLGRPAAWRHISGITD